MIWWFKLGIIKQTKLCISLSGIDVPLIQVTEYNDTNIPYDKRNLIFCTSRVHPGESNSSWIMEVINTNKW